MINIFSCIGAVVAFIPGASFFLIVLEVYLVYHIAKDSNRFHMFEFLGLATVLVGVSFVLKGAASFLQVIPVIGQFANSIVAFCFIQFIGKLANSHYSK
jgi:hypothetical protein